MKKPKAMKRRRQRIPERASSSWRRFARKERLSRAIRGREGMDGTVSAEAAVSENSST